MTAKQKATVCRLAADRVRRGWTQYQLSNEHGDVCAFGALNFAMHGHADYSHDREAVFRLGADIAQVLNISNGPGAAFRLADWNNRPERTKQQVVNGLKRAAAHFAKQAAK
jgi:hypothetical protein